MACSECLKFDPRYAIEPQAIKRQKKTGKQRIEEFQADLKVREWR